MTTLIYLAGPLFTQAEWQWNARLAAELKALSLALIVPQERAEPMLKGTEKFDPQLLFDENIRAIERADLVVAILDGTDADSGTAWECGYAHKLGKPIVGVRSDIRAGGDDSGAGLNLMLSMCCASLIKVPLAQRTDLGWVARQIHSAVTKVRPASQPPPPQARVPAENKNPN